MPNGLHRHVERQVQCSRIDELHPSTGDRGELSVWLESDGRWLLPQGLNESVDLRENVLMRAQLAMEGLIHDGRRLSNQSVS